MTANAAVERPPPPVPAGKQRHVPAHYRPEIDGLRSIAVVPVILFHAGLRIFRGGFVGVDVFFVISGYLITGILISELERGDPVHDDQRRPRRPRITATCPLWVIFGPPRGSD